MAIQHKYGIFNNFFFSLKGKITKKTGGTVSEGKFVSNKCDVAIFVLFLPIDFRANFFQTDFSGIVIRT